MRTRTLIYALATISIVTSQAYAQQDAAGQTTQTQVITGDGRTIIVNTPQAGSTVSQQPATVVQAAPVVPDTRTEQLRKARESAELGTEQKLAEKLEESRLQDEKNRADRLFGNQAAPAAAPAVTEVKAAEVVVVQPQAAPQAVQQVAPQTVQQPAAAAVIVQPVAASETVKADLKDAAEVEAVKEKYYLIGGIGTAQYYGAVNVVSNAAAGFGLGWDRKNNLAYEADFMYSNYMINEYWKPYWAAFKEMAQYDFSGAIKYSFNMTGAFRPMVGGFVTYTYRSYTNRGPCQCSGMPGDSSITSSAVNVGLLGGAEYNLTREFAVGLEYRYSMNLWARSDDRFIKPEYLINGTTPIENMSYYSFMLNGKYTF